MSLSVIETDRCLIRPTETSDIHLLAEMTADEEVCKYIPSLLGSSYEDRVSIFKEKMEKNQESIGFWTVWDKSSNEFVGTVNLYYSKEYKVEHIGLILAKERWGSGYGLELMLRLIRYGFDERQLPEIYAIISEDHVGSRSLFERLGFSLFEVLEEDEENVCLYVLNSLGS